MWIDNRWKFNNVWYEKIGNGNEYELSSSQSHNYKERCRFIVKMIILLQFIMLKDA